MLFYEKLQNTKVLKTQNTGTKINLSDIFSDLLHLRSIMHYFFS